MSTTPIPVPAAPSKLTNILSIIQAALSAIAVIPVPVVRAGDAIALTLFGILQNALTLYHQENGQPLDLTKIPLETPAP